MSLVGVDLDASRARALAGPALRALSLVNLQGDQAELPLAISLEGAVPQVGRAGVALSRRRPHLSCSDFLPLLGDSRLWTGGVHRLDAEAALGLVFRALTAALGRTVGVALSLPAYLSESQITTLYRVAETAGLPLVGSIASPLAAALAAPLPRESGLLLVIEADSHAVTWSVVERASDGLRLRLVQPGPALGRAAWVRRLVDGIAARCVRQTRRDPRESAEVEQVLYEQVLQVLRQGAANLVQLHVHGAGWYHHLMMHVDELGAMAAPLLRQAMAELDGLLAAIHTLGPLRGVVLTHSAASLPGLLPSLRARLQMHARSVEADEPGDYGDLLFRAAGLSDTVQVLPADALARMAHEIAVRVHRGDFAHGHLESVGLPPASGDTAVDSGPARLTFRGREHLLASSPFTLGRDPSCQIVFESELYPHVSSRHCAVVHERRGYVLHDHSRHGTLVNDRPVQQVALTSGDWIRLGPRGPVLRFLGHVEEEASLPAGKSAGTDPAPTQPSRGW